MRKLMFFGFVTTLLMAIFQYAARFESLPGSNNR